MITKTAQFVSKNGRSFETRILNSAQGSQPKFAFLQQTNPFNAWYEWRISWFDEGGDLEVEAKEEEEKAKRLREEEEAENNKEEVLEEEVRARRRAEESRHC